MTEGTSQGLFVVVAIVIFGIFIGLTYTLFGSEGGLSNDLENIFNDAFSKKPAFDKNADYNVEGVTPNEESDFVFDNVDTITGYVGTSSEVVIPKTINGKTVTTISGDAFNDKGITKLIMPNSVTTIEDGSIVTVTANSAVNNVADVEDDVYTNKITNLFENNKFIMTVSAAETPESSKKVIGAFSNNTIEDISMSANLEYIGSFAFFSGSLEAVVLPEGLEVIEEGSFEENILEEIEIPSTVTKLGDNAFKNNALKDVSYAKGSNLTYIGSDVFSGNNITDLEIPDSVTSIPDNAYSNSGLESVEIPKGVTSIGNNAFSNNNLTEVSIPNGVTSIGDNSFSNNKLTKVSIPNTVTKIGKEAFKENLLEEVIIPESVVEIDNGSFSDNDLTNVELPSGLQRIGDYAFYKNKLPIVNLPESLLLIGQHAFEYNELLDVKIPRKLSVLRQWTFAYNKMPKKPTIPTNIVTEENDVFTGNLFTVEKEKTQSDYYGGKDVTITNEAGFTFSNGTITDYTGTATNIVIPYVINGIPVTTIKVSAFSANSLTSVVIPNSVTSIGTYAFYNNKLTSVIIPDSVSTIGQGAFQSNSLTSVDIGNSVNSIGNAAFYSNSLTSLIIPDSVKTIGSNAFTENKTLKTVELPYGFEKATSTYQTGATVTNRAN